MVIPSQTDYGALRRAKNTSDEREVEEWDRRGMGSESNRVTRRPDHVGSRRPG